VKKDILSRSNVGFIATNRDSATAGDPYNRAFGVDASFTFFEHLNIQAFATSSYTPGVVNDHLAGRIRGTWDSDLIYWESNHLIIQRHFNPEMGWLPRRDMKKSAVQIRCEPRPGIKGVRQLFFRSSVDYIDNQAGQLETRNQDFTFESLFQSGDRIFARYSHLYDRILTSFSIQNVVTVPLELCVGFRTVQVHAKPQQKILRRYQRSPPVGFLWRPKHGSDLEPALEAQQESVSLRRATNSARFPFHSDALRLTSSTVRSITHLTIAG
jgi:hypothetical protein